MELDPVHQVLLATDSMEHPVLSIAANALQVLTQLGLVTEQELQDSIASEFNPVHIGFHSQRQGPDIVAGRCLESWSEP